MTDDIQQPKKVSLTRVYFEGVVILLGVVRVGMERAHVLYRRVTG